MIAIPGFLLGRKGILTVTTLTAVGLLLFVAAPIVAAFQAQQEEREEALDQYGVFRAEVASQPALQRALETVRIQAASLPGLMRSATAALAEAQLQTEIKAIIEANAGQLRSAQALAPARANGFDKVAVECDVTVPVSHMKDLFYALEAHAPYFFIDHADISAPMTAPLDGSKSSEPVLEVRWTVHAYRWVQPV